MERKRYRASMPENTHRFSGGQGVSDIMILLWRLGSTCIDHMETLLYGTDYKHGYVLNPHLNRQMAEEMREQLIDGMVDLLIELDMNQEDVAESWRRVETIREEDFKFGKEWVEKYGG